MIAFLSYDPSLSFDRFTPFNKLIAVKSCIIDLVKKKKATDHNILI